MTLPQQGIPPTPESLLQWALKVYPAAKYAVGVLGIAAATAIGIGLFKGDWKFALIATIAGFGLAGLALVFAHLAREKSQTFSGPGKILIWTITLLVSLSFVLFALKFFIDFFAPGQSPRSDALINFDGADTYSDPKAPVDARAYLSSFGIELAAKTAGTRVVLLNHLGSYEGRAFLPVSHPNVLTQVGSNDPVSFTLVFSKPLSKLTFLLPPLAAASDSGITFPKWEAHAFNENGSEVAQVKSDLFGSYKQEKSKMVTLEPVAKNKDCIKSVRFASDNGHFAAFSAVLIDDLSLWYAPEDRCR